MQPVPYLFFNGTCEEAVRAYARIFAAPEPQIMFVKDAPPEFHQGAGERVMHAALKVGDGWLYASDYEHAVPMAGSSVTLTFDTPEESRRIFDALAEGGVVEMPLAATFWSPGFGACTDRWGTRWMIDTASPAAAQAAAQEAVPA